MRVCIGRSTTCFPTYRSNTGYIVCNALIRLEVFHKVTLRSNRVRLAKGSDGDRSGILADSSRVCGITPSSYAHFIQACCLQTSQNQCICQNRIRNEGPNRVCSLLILNEPVGFIETRCPSNCSRRVSCETINNSQISRLHTRRDFFHLYIIQVQIRISVTIVTGSLEIDGYYLAGIIREVNIIGGPSRDTCQIILQRNLIRTTILRNQHLTLTTGRILPAEGENSILGQVDTRRSQNIGVTIAIRVRVEAETCIAIRNITIPLRGSRSSRSFGIIPELRDTTCELIEVFTPRQSERER